MLPVARIGDICVGTCSGHPPGPPIPMTGRILTGASKTPIEIMPVARIGDTVIGNCGHTGKIVSGSSNMSVEGMPVAKVGDAFSGVFSGTIVTGASNTTVS